MCLFRTKVNTQHILYIKKKEIENSDMLNKAKIYIIQ